MALFEACSIFRQTPHATQTFGLCAVGLPQVKANGLVQTKVCNATTDFPLSPVSSNAIHLTLMETS